MKETVLVAGGAGFVGSNVVRELLKRDYRVIALDDLNTGINNLEDLEDVNLSFVLGDVRDVKLIDELVSKCDYIINESCRVIAASIEDPFGDLDVNAKGNLILLQAAKKHNIKSFIYASSASVYGDAKGNVMHECLVPDPSNHYAISKMTGEHYTKMYHKVENMNTVCLRYFNVYGPYQNPHSIYGGVIPIFCNLTDEDKPLRIYGDGKQTRDFTYVDDVAKITVDCLKDDRSYGKCFNVGLGKEISINDLSDNFRKIKDNGVEYAGKRTIDNVERRECDTTYIKSELDFNCEVSLEDGINRTYEWYSKINKIKVS
tara:strand:+ start:5230 stop:6177 length:948 start_codon:yes stop_codon:yes gene_type:complete